MIKEYGYIDGAFKVIREIDYEYDCNASIYDNIHNLFETFYGLSYEDIERSWIIATNLNKDIAGIYNDSNGDSESVVMNIQMIFNFLHSINSQGFIHLHNHPSNDYDDELIDFSLEDVKSHYSLKSCSEMMGVFLYDSMVVSCGEYAITEDNVLSSKIIISDGESCEDSIVKDDILIMLLDCISKIDTPSNQYYIKSYDEAEKIYISESMYNLVRSYLERENLICKED